MTVLLSFEEKKNNLVPRGRNLFGQRQGSSPLPVPLDKATRTLGARLKKKTDDARACA